MNELVFKRKQLFDQIGMDLEDVKLIMKYQKELPILCCEEGNSISAKQLHKQLGVGRDFSTWIKGRISKYNFKESIDYNTELLIHQNGGINGKGGDRKSVDYILTVDMAKMLAMVENNKQGRLTREYFIKCEKALKLIAEWNRVREPEKSLYKDMCKELDLYMQRNENRKAEQHHYIQEANMLNKICLGANSKDIREYIDAQDKNTRDYLLIKYNEYLYKMQELDILYLRMNYNKEVRADIIQKAFKVTYPNASFFMTDVDVKRTIENKKQYVKGEKQ